MKLLIKIAFLNVLRNKRRSLITMFSIVFGCVSIMTFGGFAEAMFEGLRESVIRSQYGHLQIYKKGFSEFEHVNPEGYMLSQETVQAVTAIIEEQPGVEIVTNRLNFTGLISNGNSSVVVVGTGVEAEKESLLNSAIKMVDGDELFEEDIEGGLIGVGLAEALDIQVGDILTVLASTPDASMNAVDVVVSGIVQTGITEIDDRLLRANLPHIQNLLYTPDVTKMVVLLEDTAQTDLMKEKLLNLFESQNIEVEIQTWSDLAFFYHKVVRIFQSIFGFIKIIVMVIVIMGIANTMMMTVMERTNEIGTIRALGKTRQEVVALFLTEAFFLGLGGVVLGVATGILSAFLITEAHWMMPPPPGSNEGFPIRIFLVDHLILEAIYLGIAAAIISSLYPSFKAARLKIVDALRFI